MKKIRYILATAAILLTVAVIFGACSKGNKFEMSGGKYVDKTSGITYYAAPACYEPISISDELYGTLEKVELYKMGEADPEKWLCEANGSVYIPINARSESLNAAAAAAVLMWHQSLRG